MEPRDASNLPRKGLSGYLPGCEEAVQEFQRRCYPERDPESILPRWRWLFLDSSGRLGIKPFVWMYWKDGRIVAHQGALPVRLRVGEASLTTGWFVETMASAEVRGSPIGPMLIQKALGDLPLNLSLGQTEQMRDLQYALGWQEVAPLNTYLFVCAYDMNLRNKLPPVIAEAAALGLGLRYRWRLWRNSAASVRVTSRRIERFSEQHDDLWRAAAAAATCAVVRDASYLNWKYVDRPGADFILLEIAGSEKPFAVCVLMVVPPDPSYPYARGFIVDLVAPLDDRNRIRSVLTEAIKVLKEQGVKTVTFYLTHLSLEAQLIEFGFARRDPRHLLLVSTRGADEQVSQALLTPGNWYVTMGDSDADAYPG